MKRKHIPLSVKLEAALLQLGLDPETAELDHDPAIGLRERLPGGGYRPDENNPHYLRWLARGPHRVKTIGSGATTAGSDIGKMKHLRDITKTEEAHRQRMLAKVSGQQSSTDKYEKRPWPKRRF